MARTQRCVSWARLRDSMRLLWLGRYFATTRAKAWFRSGRSPRCAESLSRTPLHRRAVLVCAELPHAFHGPESQQRAGCHDAGIAIDWRTPAAVRGARPYRLSRRGAGSPGPPPLLGPRVRTGPPGDLCRFCSGLRQLSCWRRSWGICLPRRLANGVQQDGKG